MKIALILVLVIAAAVALMNFTTIRNVLSNKKDKISMPEDVNTMGSLHDFKVKALNGEEINLAKYKGHKVVVLNVASKCGYTPQYADWQAFHEAYGKDIIVVGFPANNFGGQEPGTNNEIAEFCQVNYGVTFQLFDKVEVIGENQHPLYQWLSKRELNGWNDKAPTWNFCKYVINEEGQVTNFFASGIKPDDAEFLKAVGL